MQLQKKIKKTKNIIHPDSNQLKKRKKKITKQQRKQRLKLYIGKAGIEAAPQKLFKIFYYITVGIIFGLSALIIYLYSTFDRVEIYKVFIAAFALWTFAFVILFFIIWAIFFIYIDFRLIKRKNEIEAVLPDFLQLTASNINAGMTVDKALWFAVRPRFGVLAREIEDIAKDTMSGADLKASLVSFGSRYDSVTLKRTISMINEGIESGGEIGELLNRIALDIQEQRAMLNEMAANVTTYVIFISFAAIVAAPILFSLSGVLIDVVGTLSETLGGSANEAATSGIPLSFSGTGISAKDFKIFVVVSLTISSIFSSIMVGAIKKGNIHSGLKYIPIFIFVSVSLYLVAQFFAGKLIGVFFI
jgi:pilus assembly protein TadC